ncbi:GNAT family N-acetyltransferase [uncultured Methanobrevibacter sp.]|uniref:GNAT family N-acetyltransferase n=1 Tax=uncultured Methanobrevibacter sp. TaxID=253161 RepID=UPI00261ABA8C|nr:GNAT family N-acetyltransferase [uncultured Methanobrevibacter sp.]
MEIRTATIDDLDTLYNIERECFPQSEAAKRNEIEERLITYPNHFLVLKENTKTVSFINGFTTDEKDLKDEMYENASMHNESGNWQMIFGVNTLPEYRKHGYASKLIKQFIDNAKKENRLGVVLTCKQNLVSYYSKFGFGDEGISESKHGGEVWHQMRLTFKK